MWYRGILCKRCGGEVHLGSYFCRECLRSSMRDRTRLDERNMAITKAVTGGRSQAEVARKYGLSRERVRQIVTRGV